MQAPRQAPRPPPSGGAAAPPPTRRTRVCSWLDRIRERRPFPLPRSRSSSAEGMRSPRRHDATSRAEPRTRPPADEIGDAVATETGARTERRIPMAAIEIQGLSKRFGDVAAVDDLSFTVARGSRDRLPRPERRRQDDDPADAARPGRADRRHRHHRRAALRRPRRSRSATSARCSRPTQLPSRPAGARSPARARHRRRAARSRASTRCSTRSASPTPATAASRASRSACASGSAWPARCSASPEVLILDEPANGLDPEGVHWLRQFLRDVRRRAAARVLVSSHLLAEVAQTVDDVVIIAQRAPRHAVLAGRPGPPLAGRRARADAAGRGAARRARRAGHRRRARRRATCVMAFETTHRRGRSRGRRSRRRHLRDDAEHFDLEEMFLELTTPEGASR